MNSAVRLSLRIAIEPDNSFPEASPLVGRLLFGVPCANEHGTMETASANLSEGPELPIKMGILGHL